MSVWGALWSLVGRGPGEVCGGVLAPQLSIGTVCGVASVVECSVVQWGAHTMCSSSQCDVAALPRPQACSTHANYHQWPGDEASASTAGVA